MRDFLRWRQELSPGRISSFDGGHGVTRPGGICGRGRDRDALLNYRTDPFRGSSRLETAHLSAWGETGPFVFVEIPPQEEPEPLA